MKIKYLVLLVLLKKTEYDTKVTEIENKLNNPEFNIINDKYITTPEFNSLAADEPLNKYLKIIVFNTRLLSHPLRVIINLTQSKLFWY